MTARRRAFIWVWMLPVLLLAFWLGARMLDADPIWGDERNSIFDAGGAFYGPLSPVDNWNRVASRNPWHAPGFFILLNGWGRIAGWQPPALRAFALLAGMFAVVFTYRLGRDTISPRAGLYAAAALATCAFFVHYLHELRMYALIAALTAFTLWVYLQIVNARRKPARWLWLGLLAGAAGLLYTHYLASLPLVAIGLYHLLLGVRLFLHHRRRASPSSLSSTQHSALSTQHSVLSPQHWLFVVGVLVLAGVLFLPWARVLASGLERAAESDALHLRALNGLETVERILYLYGNGAIPLLIIALLLAWRARGRGGRQAWFFALAIALLMLIMNAVLQIMHEGRLRYLILLAPSLALLVGAGLASLRRSWGRAVSILALGVWMLVGIGATMDETFLAGLDGDGTIFPLNRIADDLRGRVQAGDVVVNYLPDDGLDTLKYEPIASFYLAPVSVEYLMMQTLPDPAEQARQQADAIDLLAARRRVWIASMPNHAPSSLGAFVVALDTNFDYCQTVTDQPALRLDLYTRAGAAGACPVAQSSS